MSDDADLIVVYSGSAIEANLVKGVLEANDIQATLQDELMGNIAPQYIAPGGYGAVKVLVMEDDAEDALVIIEGIADGSLDDEIGGEG